MTINKYNRKSVICRIVAEVLDVLASTSFVEKPPPSIIQACGRSTLRSALVLKSALI